MDIKGSTILILGGWGLVGSAISRKLIQEKPKRIIIASLLRSQSEEAVSALCKEYPKLRKNFFIPWWGNIFVRHSLKDMDREDILKNPRTRALLIEDIFAELTDQILQKSTIYQLINRYKPEIIIDCINTATAIAYQNLFKNAHNVMIGLKKIKEKKKNPHFLEDIERLLSSLYIPQLIRHVQLLYKSMQICETKMYIKIGTSGTGGMGFNIPYTHSEQRPSSVLLSKSSVAGAHTMLLFLMGRTPNAPITKEIKPTASIAWKKVCFGEIKHHGKPIQLYDCPPEKGIRLKNKLQIKNQNFAIPLNETLESVYIDTGENGLFSRHEFEAIAVPGQMEFVTPEEIAENTLYEIKGGNTGNDVINALDNSVLEPTYRAGFLFQNALKHMQELEKKHGVDSIAFENLGPPRLSKLLYEAYLLKLEFANFDSVLKTNPSTISKQLYSRIKLDKKLRATIISIGIPILLPDGKTLLRGNEIKTPVSDGENEIPITKKSINSWAHNGWVDLRASNMKAWKDRLNEIIKMVEQAPKGDTSSRFLYTHNYWNNFQEIDPGKLVGWIFSYEDNGMRMKA